MKQSKNLSISVHSEIEASESEHKVRLSEPLHQQAARLITDLRTRAGLTQKQLAKRVGTTQPAIARLEAPNYHGHSLTMLQRIANALDGKIEIRVSPERKASPQLNFSHSYSRSQREKMDNR